ncbi:MAG: DMT family transporter [Burkholderiaceae bacterium]|nr:MAG: DMT family transporter [Burkholderiaceae bacterium]
MTEASPTAAAPGRQRTALLPTIALVGVTAIWGSTFVVVSRAIEQMPAVTFLAWRFGLATLVLILLRPRSLRLLDRRDLVRGLWMGMALGLGYILQTVGLYTTPVTVSGFITGMFLVFTPIVAWVLLREPIPSSAWWAVGIATVGLAVMSLNGFSMGLGELLTLGGALAFAVQIVGLSAFSTPAKAYPLAIVQLGVTALMCTIGSTLESGPKVPPTRDVWVSLLFLALAATALSFVVQSWGQAHLPPTTAAVVLTLEPVFAGIFGFLVGEDITARMVIGGALVLVAMYVVELGPRRAREAQLAHLEP